MGAAGTKMAMDKNMEAPNPEWIVAMLK